MASLIYWYRKPSQMTLFLLGNLSADIKKEGIEMHGEVDDD
jgi:hypothetical protein